MCYAITEFDASSEQATIQLSNFFEIINSRELFKLCLCSSIREPLTDFLNNSKLISVN